MGMIIIRGNTGCLCKTGDITVCFCYVVLRFILDDSALYLSDKCETDTVDLRRGESQDVG